MGVAGAVVAYKECTGRLCKCRAALVVAFVVACCAVCCVVTVIGVAAVLFRAASLLPDCWLLQMIVFVERQLFKALVEDEWLLLGGAAVGDGDGLETPQAELDALDDDPTVREARGGGGGGQEGSRGLGDWVSE